MIIDMNTALIVGDIQVGIVARFPNAEKLLARLAQAIGAARAAGVPVVFVRSAFRAGGPEISRRNKAFGAMIGTPAVAGGENDEARAIHPSVAPLSTEVVVTKRRTSAFSGGDLDIVLRSLDVDHLVLTGLATSGVVLSTVRQAADLDFRLTVLNNGCQDFDEEVHDVLVNRVFPRQADVLTVEDWVSSLDGS
jgi:nicotinamidase-related amidase